MNKYGLGDILDKFFYEVQRAFVIGMLILIETTASWNRNLIIVVKKLGIHNFFMTWNINFPSTLLYALQNLV